LSLSSNHVCHYQATSTLIISYQFLQSKTSLTGTVAHEFLLTAVWKLLQAILLKSGTATAMIGIGGRRLTPPLRGTATPTLSTKPAAPIMPKDALSEAKAKKDLQRLGEDVPAIFNQVCCCSFASCESGRGFLVDVKDLGCYRCFW